MATAKVIRTVRVAEDDVVEIQWRLADGGVFVQRVEIPPRATRDARGAICVGGNPQEA